MNLTNSESRGYSTPNNKRFTQKTRKFTTYSRNIFGDDLVSSDSDSSAEILMNRTLPSCFKTSGAGSNKSFVRTPLSPRKKRFRSSQRNLSVYITEENLLESCAYTSDSNSDSENRENKKQPNQNSESLSSPSRTTRARRELDLNQTAVIETPKSPQVVRNKATQLQNLSASKRNLSSVRRKKSFKRRMQPSYINCKNDDDLNETYIECSSSSNSSINCNDDAPHVAPTELDLFLELIKNDENSTHNRIKTTNKRCRKGGYVEQFRNLLQKNRMDQRFLVHDRRLGLKTCTRLRIIELCESFGVHLAKVQMPNNTICGVILSPDLASRAQVGNEIEAYCDKPPIKINYDAGTDLDIYVQPNKLILL